MDLKGKYSLILNTIQKMSTKFSQELIDITEAAILSDRRMEKDTANVPAISYRDYEAAEYGWKIITNSESNHYIQFGSNAGGMQSYGFYKATDGKIYIIQAWVNAITKVYIPSKKWDCLHNVIQDEEEMDQSKNDSYLNYQRI